MSKSQANRHAARAGHQRLPPRAASPRHGTELTQYVPELEPSAGQLGFSVPLRLRTSRGELRLMTTVTTFATAVDVTLAELKLEAFLPVD